MLDDLYYRQVIYRPRARKMPNSYTHIVLSRCDHHRHTNSPTSLSVAQDNTSTHYKVRKQNISSNRMILPCPSVGTNPSRIPTSIVMIFPRSEHMRYTPTHPIHQTCIHLPAGKARPVHQLLRSPALNPPRYRTGD